MMASTAGAHLGEPAKTLAASDAHATSHIVMVSRACAAQVSGFRKCSLSGLQPLQILRENPLTVPWHAASMLLPAARPDLPSRVSAGVCDNELPAAAQAATRDPSAPRPPLITTCFGVPPAAGEAVTS